MVWRVIQPRLDQCERDKIFDRDVIMCAIKWLERQAKRTGLDITASRLSEEFLKHQTDAELIEIYRQLGVVVPRDEICGPEAISATE